MGLFMFPDLLEATANPRFVAGIGEGLFVEPVKSLIVESALKVLQRESELEHLSVWVDVEDQGR